jgi:cystathionine gamma-synthase
MAPSSSRCAELHIVLFPEAVLPLGMQCRQHVGMGISSRYAEHCLSLITSPTEILTNGQRDYLEERSVPADSAVAAKYALRCRIANALVRNCLEDCPAGVAEQGVEVGLSSSGKSVTEDDVFLFPTGMCAVWNAYDLVTRTR